MAVNNPLELADVAKKETIKLLPTAFREASILTKMGSTNVAYETKLVRDFTTGGAQNTFEGEMKKSTEQSFRDVPVYTGKQVSTLFLSEEVEDNEDGKKVIAAKSAGVLTELMHSLDITILNGTNAADGTAITQFADVNLKDNARQSVVTTTAEEGLVELLKSNRSRQGVIASTKGFDEIAFAQNAAGLPKYPISEEGERVKFFNSWVTRGSALGKDGYKPEEVEIENDNLFLVGNFGQIGRGFNGVKVKRLDQATWDGISLAQHNLVAYVYELFYSFYIFNPESFGILKAAPAEEGE